MSTIDKRIADFFSGGLSKEQQSEKPNRNDCVVFDKMAFSYLFFSDVRKDISDLEKYKFARELVEFADQSQFEAVYFPERHFNEFGSVYANNGIMAAYFAPITSNVRLRTAAITNTLHHPVEIVENWAMVDVLSNGRVDLGFGSGWAKPDFILSPDTYENRASLRNERIPIIQKLWRGESVDFPGPGGESYSTTVYPRPLQKELNVWYVSNSDQGFSYAGQCGYNIFSMLYGLNLTEFGKKVELYRKARKEAGFDAGRVTLMLHTFVHPDAEWVSKVVELPFKEYIRSSLIPQMKAAGTLLRDQEIEKMVDYSYTRYFKTCGLFGSVQDCQEFINEASRKGVNEIAFLQDFGIDYQYVIESLCYLEQLVSQNQ